MGWGLWVFAADAAALDVSGVFNGLSDLINTKLVRVSSWIASIKHTVEPVTWLLGSFLALVPGSFAIYKWIYYRYSRLPERLDDMLEKEELRLRDARKHLLGIMEKPTPRKAFETPMFVVPSLGRALRIMRWARWRNGSSLVSADESLQAALDDIGSQLKYWERKHSNYLRQQATAYLLKGAIAAANGSKDKNTGKDGLEHNREALIAFSKALEIDESDAQALEYVAHQQRILGMFDEAFQNYSRLSQLMTGPEPESALVRMRTLRYMGEILEKKYDATEIMARLITAKQTLQDALANVPTIARDDLDHAYVHRVFASVEMKRKALGSAKFQSERAERIFLDLIRRKRHVKEAEVGLIEVRSLMETINRLQNGENFVDDGGGSNN
jgi:hypothetical protein